MSHEAGHTKRMSMIVSKGRLDWAYPPSSWPPPLRHVGMPNIVAAIPGVDAAATAMMKSLIGSKACPRSKSSAPAQSRAVRMIACQMTMDLFGYTMDDMIEGLLPGGAASYIETASGSEINLFI